jgi:hypothetical protein
MKISAQVAAVGDLHPIPLARVATPPLIQGHASFLVRGGKFGSHGWWRDHAAGAYRREHPGPAAVLDAFLATAPDGTD